LSRLILKNSNKFWLRTPIPFYAVHLGTYHLSTREFMVFYIVPERRVYIEEITGGILQEIRDESLWSALGQAAEVDGLTDIAAVQGWLQGITGVESVRRKQ